jgi:NAD(P)-dependent dehydrogenase (short-subunit alcohol dehydrogenase family)
MSDPLFRVEDQVVLVSGGSRGIGRAIAAGFAERGAKVIITGREATTLAETAAAIDSEGNVSSVVCDIAVESDIDACIARVLGEQGRIDTLVNVAGVNRRMRAEEYTAEDYDFILDINLKGAWLMSIAVGKHMLERGSGNQINVDSLNSYAPLSRVLPYAMSKAGMVTMTRGLACEWGGRGVRVNSIAPGFILTDLTRKLWSSPALQSWNEEATPLGRLGTPEDLVGAALFLASPAAAYVNGHTLRVDGGISSGIPWPIDRA